MTLNRRSLVRGAVWTAPAVAVSSAAPALAASGGPITGTNITPQNFTTVYTKRPTNCAPATNPQTGYIDTMCCNSPVLDPAGSNSDCAQDPATSQGYWLESPIAGTATIDAITTTYKFNYDVKLQECANTVAKTKYTGAPSTWSSCNIYNGWTATQVDARTIRVTYTGSGLVDTSTAAAGSGFCTGYFLNFTVTQGCYRSGVVQRQYSTTMTYTDATGQKTWTKNSTWQGI